jgi:hypothetical protein
MTKVLRNFWLDSVLAALLALNIVLLVLPGPFRARTHLSFVGHLHAILGTLLAISCLIHIGLHWRWFRAVLTGRAKGRVKFVMNSLVAVLMIAAVLSGRVAIVASALASGLHRFVGYFVLLGLLVHTVKHARWLLSVAKRLAIGPEQGSPRQSV